MVPGGPVAASCNSSKVGMALHRPQSFQNLEKSRMTAGPVPYSVECSLLLALQNGWMRVDFPRAPSESIELRAKCARFQPRFPSPIAVAVGSLTGILGVCKSSQNLAGARFLPDNSIQACLYRSTGRLPHLKLVIIIINATVSMVGFRLQSLRTGRG